MLDLLIVNVGNIKKRVYQELGNEFSAVEPPFWAALTADFIRRSGYSVEILDANVYNYTYTETAKIIEEKNPRFVGVIVFSQQANTCAPIMDSVTELCNEIRNTNKDRQIILSGWHPSALPRRTMEEVPCNCLIVGEGFHTYRELLNNSQMDNILGLWYWENGIIRNNPDRTPIENLDDELPDVAWDLLPLNEGQYRGFNWLCLQDLDSRSQCATIYTSLGCPYHCTFCAIHAAFKSDHVRFWSPEWVIKQLSHLYHKYGVTNVNLLDEIFILNKNHYMKIAEGIINEKLPLNICAFARVDIIDKISFDDMKILKKAGINWLKLGIESTKSEMLAGVDKGAYDCDTSRRVVKKIHDAGMDICANFMFGLPGDTWDSMQNNLNFAYECNCAFPSFFCTMAPPGSELYERASELGLVLPDTWDGYAQQGYNFLPLSTDELSAKEVLAFRDYAFTSYFTNPRYLHMIEQKFGKKALTHIEDMAKIPLKRKILEM